jgi:hypothetical protein
VDGDVVVGDVVVHERLGLHRGRHAWMGGDLVERNFVERNELERYIVEFHVVECHVVERERLELTR